MGPIQKFFITQKSKGLSLEQAESLFIESLAYNVCRTPKKLLKIRRAYRISKTIYKDPKYPVKTQIEIKF